MTMEIINNYNNYAIQNMAGNNVSDGTKNKKTNNSSKTESSNKTKSESKTENSSKFKSTAEYMRELEKLAPSVEFRIGNSISSAKSGKTLTINPKLLEKMKNNPEQEKETKDMIKGVEAAVNLVESINKASGWTVVYKHSYIDENGKYYSCGYYRNDFMLNMSDELREERRENAEKLIEKTKENAAKEIEELENILEEKKEEKEVEELEDILEEKKEEKEVEELEGILEEKKEKEEVEELKGILEERKEKEEVEELEDILEEKKEAEKAKEADIKTEEESAYYKIKQLLYEKMSNYKDAKVGMLYLDDVDFNMAPKNAADYVICNNKENSSAADADI